MLKVHPTPLAGLWVIEPPRYQDARGAFSETWNRQALAAAGCDLDFVQDNQSYSKAAATVRGLHYQSPPHAQTKLVRCLQGRLFDVAVDVRPDSSTYAQWYGIELSAENGKQLWVPSGFLHGFMTLEPNCQIAYKCSAYYAPAAEGSVRWDDPDLAIRWPDLGSPPQLSAKDRDAMAFRDFVSPF